MNEKSLKFQFTPLSISLFTIFWSYIVNDTKMPGREAGVALFTILIFWLYNKFYKDIKYVFECETNDLFYFGFFLLIGILAHLPTLNLNIAGDELHHAEKASFILVKLSEILYQFPALSLDEIRSRFLLVLDPRAMSVQALWRYISVIVVILSYFVLALFKKINLFSEPKRKYSLIFFLILLSIWGWWIQVQVDNHPPMRLLPLFLGELFFGLNNFAFRLPGVFCVALLSTLVYKKLNQNNSFSIYNFIISLSLGFIPVVFYVAEAAEASIYGYFVWLAVFIFLSKYIKDNEPKNIYIAGLIVGVGTLFRQTSILLWIPITYLILTNSNLRKSRLLIIQTYLPFLLSIPYFFTVKNQGHGAVDTNSSLVNKFIEIISDGSPFIGAVSAHGIEWILLAISASIYLLFKDRKSRFIISTAVLLFFLYNLIMVKYFWAVGRYQSEFVSALIAYLIIEISQHITAPRKQTVFALLLSVMAFGTVNVNMHLGDDINYNEWPKMKITTSANFPYSQALSYIKKQEDNSKFIILGGTPNQKQIVAWLGGYSIQASRIWLDLQWKYSKIFEETFSPESTQEQMSIDKIKFLLIQYGTRREMQHRTPTISNWITHIESFKNRDSNAIIFDRTFGDEQGGYIDIYKLNK